MCSAPPEQDMPCMPTGTGSGKLPSGWLRSVSHNSAHRLQQLQEPRQLQGQDRSSPVQSGQGHRRNRDLPSRRPGSGTGSIRGAAERLFRRREDQLPADRLRQNRIPGMWTIHTDDTHPEPRMMRITPLHSNRKETGKPARYPGAEGIRIRQKRKAEPAFGRRDRNDQKKYR